MASNFPLNPIDGNAYVINGKVYVWNETKDGALKKIYITNVANVDSKELYSSWKNWALTSTNLKYLQAFRTIGGEPTIAGQYTPVYYFLTNGWKVVIDGSGVNVAFSYNLYSEDGSSPIIALNGATAVLNNSDIGLMSAGSEVSYTSILNALNVLNNGIKNASKLIPHNADI